MIAKPYLTGEMPRLTLTARILRLLSTSLFLAACLSAAAILSFWMNLPDVSLLADPEANLTITVRDWQGEEQPFMLGPDNPDWTPLEQFPENLTWAVIVAEDAMFYKHRGIDIQAIKEALIYDIQQKRMARGASTITQQLAKNLYLTREKTLTRKLREVAIAWQIENSLSKERILELYLNLVELGPMVHGMTAGARHHLAKPASELSTAEATFLAAILPGPRVAFNPEKKPVRVGERAKQLLHYMQLRRVIDEPQFELASREVDILSGVAPTPPPEHDTLFLHALGERAPWHLPLERS